MLYFYLSENGLGIHWLGVDVLSQNFVEKYADQITVEDMLADLIPGFLKNKANDLIILNQAIDQKDYDKIKKIGHNWKGACSSYGFLYLGEVGKQFEILSDSQNQEKLKILIDSLPQYLNHIEVTFMSPAGEDMQNSSDHGN